MIPYSLITKFLYKIAKSSYRKAYISTDIAYLACSQDHGFWKLNGSVSNECDKDSSKKAVASFNMITNGTIDFIISNFAISAK